MGKTGGIPPRPPQDSNQNQPIKPIDTSTKPAPLEKQGGKTFLGMSFTPMQWAKFMVQLANDAIRMAKEDEKRMIDALKEWRKKEDEQQ